MHIMFFPYWEDLCLGIKPLVINLPWMQYRWHFRMFCLIKIRVFLALGLFWLLLSADDIDKILIRVRMCWAQILFIRLQRKHMYWSSGWHLLMLMLIIWSNFLRHMINPWSIDKYDFKTLILAKNLEVWLYVGHNWLLTNHSWFSGIWAINSANFFCKAWNLTWMILRTY